MYLCTSYMFLMSPEKVGVMTAAHVFLLSVSLYITALIVGLRFELGEVKCITLDQMGRQNQVELGDNST